MADDDSRAGKRYTDKELIDYVDRVHAVHDDGLEAAFSAPGAEDMPAIQVGKSEGKLLELLAGMIGARRAVEVGTLAGYSAIRLARGMADDGMLWTIEFDPKHAAVAAARIAAAGLAERITVEVGAGVDILPTLAEHGPFDLVFLDADKAGYADYGRWALANLRPGGLLIGDNAYLFGGLLDDTDPARAMRAFHEEVAEHFDSVCVPTPDGLVVAIKN